MAMAAPFKANPVTEFLYTANFGSATITVYKINGDGSLSPDRGTSFAAGEAPRKIAALGGSLIAAANTSLTVYSVDKATGSLRLTDSAVLSQLHDFVVDSPASLIYAAANDQIFTYKLGEGKLQPVVGSPFSFSSIVPAGADIRAAILALDRSHNQLLVSLRVSSPGVGPVVSGFMSRHPDGSLEPPTSLPSPPASVAASSVTTPRGPVIDSTGRFAYVLDTEVSEVFAYRVEAGKLISLSPAFYSTGEQPVSAVVVAP